jgi:hypothetical protein
MPEGQNVILGTFPAHRDVGWDLPQIVIEPVALIAEIPRP